MGRRKTSFCYDTHFGGFCFHVGMGVESELRRKKKVNRKLVGLF